jgi:hypothetical protein
MKNSGNLQEVCLADNNDEYCQKCGNSLEMGKITFTGKTIDEATVRFEEYKCGSCGSIFIMRYDFFDAENHICPAIFNGDPNDPSFRYEMLWAPIQRKALADHLSSCSTCQARRDNEFLADALLASVLHKKLK